MSGHSARGFGLLRASSPDEDLSPITGGLDEETEVVETSTTPTQREDTPDA